MLKPQCDHAYTNLSYRDFTVDDRNAAEFPSRLQELSYLVTDFGTSNSPK